MTTMPDAVRAVLGSERDTWECGFAFVSHAMAEAIVNGHLTADDIATYNLARMPDEQSRNLAHAAGLRYHDEQGAGDTEASTDEIACGVSILRALTEGDITIGEGHGFVFAAGSDPFDSYGVTLAEFRDIVRGLSVQEAAQLILDADRWWAKNHGH